MSPMIAGPRGRGPKARHIPASTIGSRSLSRQRRSALRRSCGSRRASGRGTSMTHEPAQNTNDSWKRVDLVGRVQRPDQSPSRGQNVLGVGCRRCASRPSEYSTLLAVLPGGGHHTALDVGLGSAGERREQWSKRLVDVGCRFSSSMTSHLPPFERGWARLQLRQALPACGM